MPSSAYIYDAIRTPRSKGKSSGELHEVKPVKLISGLLNELKSRHQLDTSKVSDVIMGCTSPLLDQGSNIAKAAVTSAGWHETVPGFQLDRFCASGLEAVNIASAKVMSGQESLIVAGGVESMSRVPMGAAGGAMMTDVEYVMGNLSVPQGIGADLIATLENWTREDVDSYALESQKRAAHARDNGWFDKSVVPVKDENGLTILEKDTFIKTDTSMDKLKTLKPSFAEMGKHGFDDMALMRYPQVSSVSHVHTAGNASGIVDGASAVLIGSKDAGESLGLQPRGRILSTAVLANDPVIMLTGPGPAAKLALKKAGLTVKDVDLWEINEAFASVAMRYMKDLEISHEVTNVNGGAIAMGHPLGATGAMLISIALDELERRQQKRAMISLCVGGGMGISTLIERV